MDSRGRIGPVAVVGTFVGLAGLAAGITLLYLGMRSVMEIGGVCAEGGPYQIRQECPDGVGVVMFGGAWGGLISAAVFGLSVRRFGARYLMLLLWAWPALFLSLGWNFLEYGLDAPGEEGAVTAWIICAVMFGLMGGLPLLFLAWPSQLRATFWPPEREDDTLQDRASRLAGLVGRSFRNAGAPGRTHAPPRAAPPARDGAGSAAPARPVPPATPAAPASSTSPPPTGLWPGLPGAAPPTGAPGASPDPTGGDVVGQLERLARLRDSGALDEQEYERAKRSVLGGGV